jgi:hypothetical protein
MILITNCYLDLLAKYYTAVVIKSVALWYNQDFATLKPTLATSTLQIKRSHIHQISGRVERHGWGASGAGLAGTVVKSFSKTLANFFKLFWFTYTCTVGR